MDYQNLNDDPDAAVNPVKKINPIKSFIGNMNSGQKISITVTLFLIFLFPALMLASTSQTRTTPHASIPSEIPKLPTITPLRVSPTPKIASYWISFGPKGQPDISYNTAEKLLSLLSVKNIDAVNVERWLNGGWDGHVKGIPFNDFPIKPGQGYLLRVNNNPQTIHDKLPFTAINSSSYDVLPGWNFISIPSKTLLNLGPKVTAETVCKSINSQNGSVSEINNHPASTRSDYWLPYKCGSQKNDFAINDGEGYFVKASASSKWVLPVK